MQLFLRKLVFLSALLMIGCAGCGGIHADSRIIPDIPKNTGFVDQQSYPRVVSAINSARESVQVSPQSAKAWGHLAMVFDAHEFSSQAQACYRRAMECDDKDPRWEYLLASSLEQADPQQAERLYRRQRDHELPGCEPQIRLTELLLAQNRIDEAAAVLEPLLRSIPNNARVQFRWAICCDLRGQRAKALDASSKAVSLAPNSPSVRELYARLLFADGDVDTAQNEMKTLRSLSQRDAGWPDQCLEEVRMMRQDPSWQSTKAQWLSQHGQVLQAIARFETLSEEHPEEWMFAIDLARAQLSIGKKEGAVATITKAIATHWEIADLWKLRGSAHLLCESWTQACDDYGQAIDINPSDCAAWSDLAFAQEQRHLTSEAIASLKKALMLDPLYDENRVRLIRLLLEQHDCLGAGDQIEFLEKLTPDHRELKSLRKACLEEASQSLFQQTLPMPGETAAFCS